MIKLLLSFYHYFIYCLEYNIEMKFAIVDIFHYHLNNMQSNMEISKSYHIVIL